MILQRLNFLDAVIDRIQSLPVLALLAYRPEFSPPWTGYGHVTTLSLNRLSRREVAGIVESVTGGKSLPSEVLEQIVAKTDGVPLFIEELTKTILEAGFLTETDDHYVLKGPLLPIAIPSTLHDALLSRLDRLSNGKEIAQLGACIGRVFMYDLLAAVSGQKGNELDNTLAELVRSELVFRRGKPPEARYTFKHALVQDAAYQSLLKRTRRQYHDRIAGSLEHDFPEICDAQPELVAHHYGQAGKPEVAVTWWLEAGRRALAQSANAEAIHHLRAGLEALAELPDSEQRRRDELALQTAIGPALFATLGYASPEVAEVYQRGRELCEQIGDSPDLFPVQWGLYAFHVVRADLGIAQTISRQMLDEAERIGDRNLRLEALQAYGLARYFQGAPAEALDYMERAMALDSPERDRSFTLQSGQDAVVCAATYAGMCLWLLGRHDDALASAKDAIALARRLEHPFSLAYALNFGGWLAFMLGDADAGGEFAEEQITLSEELGFFWVTLGKVTRGWVRAQRGEVKEGIAELRHGLAGYRATGARTGQTLLLAMEADVCLLAGEVEVGLVRVQEALDAGEQTGERVWTAELYRLQGNLRGATAFDAAKGALREAIAISREQGAIAVELRAVTDLVRLLDGRADSDAERVELTRLCEKTRAVGLSRDVERAEGVLGAPPVATTGVDDARAQPTLKDAAAASASDADGA